MSDCVAKPALHADALLSSILTCGLAVAQLAECTTISREAVETHNVPSSPSTNGQSFFARVMGGHVAALVGSLAVEKIRIVTLIDISDILHSFSCPVPESLCFDLRTACLISQRKRHRP